MSKVIRLSDDVISKLDQVLKVEESRINSPEDQAIFDVVCDSENDIILFLANYYLLSRQ